LIDGCFEARHARPLPAHARAEGKAITLEAQGQAAVGTSL